MATINKMWNDYTEVGSITLRHGTHLIHGHLASSGTITGTSTGTTLIYTVPTARSFVITDIIFAFSDTTGITGTLVASVGTNSATYNNILPSTTFTGWNQLSDFYHISTAGVVHTATSGEAITLNITTAFGGTSVLFDVALFGVIL